MAAKNAKTTEKPLAELTRLIGSVTNDQLLKAIDLCFDEAASRVANYADLLDESDPPRDALNEGLAFAVRLAERINPWRRPYCRRIRRALDELKDGPDA